MFQKRLALGALALMLAGCGLSPGTSASPTGTGSTGMSKASSLDVYDSAVDQAARTAKAAVEAYNHLSVQLAAAKTPQERHALQQTITSFLYDTFRTITAIVEEDAANPQQSKAMREQIRGLASRGMQTGVSPEDKIRYAHQAMLSISVIRTF